ncbi:hypothetical protein GLYMA_07G154650v4 [Glycine max]|nr:hypothetical protein GLYMA_07G154650v4 [Glycine max]KAH1087013.1 hypothetical protein GYH30_018509 [Glycine max]
MVKSVQNCHLLFIDVSILASTLSRLDGDAPHYKKYVVECLPLFCALFVNGLNLDS